MAQRYYAHPQNAFWRIMGEVLGFAVELPYEQRVAAMQRAKVALWDVLAACERPGSLDASIRRDSERANDIASLLASHLDIRRICFNGGAAEATFRRHHGSLLTRSDLTFMRLPSTSPAHASLGYAQKCATWQAALMD
jgi:hypoxanthine-DNA glycosylase